MKYLLMLLLGGCTNAQWVQLKAFGSPGKITCYSGGKVIGSWASTGKIATEDRSDGWYFEDADTKRLIRVSGTCIVEN